MKSFNTISNIVLAIAVIILFVLHFKKDEKETAKGPEITRPAIKIEEKSSKIVFVNTDSVMTRYDLVAEIKAESERDRKNQEAQFESKYLSFQKEVEDFKEKAQTMTQDQGMAKQQELMMKEQELGELREKYNDQYLQKEQDRQDRLMKSITDFMERNYNNTNYTYILGFAHGGGILYAQDSLDITPEVIKGLNEEYAASKKGTK